MFQKCNFIGKRRAVARFYTCKMQLHWAITTRGFGIDETVQLTHWMCDILDSLENGIASLDSHRSPFFTARCVHRFGWVQLYACVHVRTCSRMPCPSKSAGVVPNQVRALSSRGSPCVPCLLQGTAIIWPRFQRQVGWCAVPGQRHRNEKEARRKAGNGRLH